MNAYIPKQFDYWPTLEFENCEIGDVGIGIDSEKRGERYVPFHPHGPLFEVTCILEGRGVSYAGTCPIKVQKGDIFLSVPFEEHRLDSDPESPLCQEFLTFGVRGERFLPLSDRLWKLGLPPQNRVFHDESVVTLIDLILEELQNGSKIYRKEILSSLTDQVALRVLRAFWDYSPKPLSVVPSDKELCEHITHYIDTHLYTLRTLTELGEALRYNYSYLSSRYRNVTGHTIKEYYTRRRMEEAKRLLSTQNGSISQVAEQLGYSGVYAFSKAFKAYYRMPPSDLLKKA